MQPNEEFLALLPRPKTNHTGESKGGKPIYTHLCRKRRAFWEEDNEEIVRRREAMMEGRVYHAEDTEERDLKKSVSYVPEGVKMGGAAERRRGPVNFK